MKYIVSFFIIIGVSINSIFGIFTYTFDSHFSHDIIIPEGINFDETINESTVMQSDGSIKNSIVKENSNISHTPFSVDRYYWSAANIDHTTSKTTTDLLGVSKNNYSFFHTTNRLTEFSIKLDNNVNVKSDRDFSIGYDLLSFGEFATLAISKITLYDVTDDIMLIDSSIFDSPKLNEINFENVPITSRGFNIINLNDYKLTVVWIGENPSIVDIIVNFNNNSAGHEFKFDIEIENSIDVIGQSQLLLYDSSLVVNSTVIPEPSAFELLLLTISLGLIFAISKKFK